MNWPIQLYRLALLHPRRTVVIAALVTLAIAPGAARLTLATDGRALVPTSSAEVQFDRAVRDRHGITDPIVVLIRARDPRGIFNEGTLSLVRDLTADIQRIDGIRPEDVMSLATERADRVFPGTFTFRPLLDPVPATEEEMARLRGDLDAVGLYRGTMISLDGRSTSIFVGTPPDRDRVATYRAIEGVLAKRRAGAGGPPPDDIDVIGAPVAESLLGHHILEDLGAPEALVGRRTARAETPSAGGVARLRAFIGDRIGLVPAAVAIMALVFFASFRSAAAAGLAMMKIGCCLLLVFGLMGWLGVPIYLTIAVMPVMLIATGASDEIHILNRYASLLRDGLEKRDAIRTAMNELWEPVVKTSVTTALGFLSFAASPLPAVRAFGIFTGAGTMLCILWALTVTPALAVLLDSRRFIAPRARRGSVYRRLAAAVIARRRAVLAGAVVAVAVSAIGASRVVVQDSWVEGFSPASKFYQATQRFDEQFLGAHMLMVTVGPADQPLVGELSGSDVDHQGMKLPARAAGDPAALAGRRVTLRRGANGAVWVGSIERAVVEGEQVAITFAFGSSAIYNLGVEPRDRVRYEIAQQPLVRPEALQRIAALERFLETRAEHAVGGTLGPAKYLATTRYLVEARKEGARALPADQERIEELWDLYAKIRGPERLRQLVDGSFREGVITVFLKNANFVATRRLLDEIRAFERAELAPRGLAVGFAGDVAVSQALIDAIVTTQLSSLLLSILGVLLVTALMGRSLEWGLYSVIPCSLMVLVSFGLMGWLGTPLGVATSMFASMTVGTGVDYAIHLLDRWRLERSKGRDPEDALVEALAITVRPIAVDALSVSLGFGVLLLSQVPANARLGARVFVSILGCMLVTLVVLPAIMAWRRPRIPDAR